MTEKEILELVDKIEKDIETVFKFVAKNKETSNKISEHKLESMADDLWNIGDIKNR